jgi:hypothetical protein
MSPDAGCGVRPVLLLHAARCHSVGWVWAPYSAAACRSARARQPQPDVASGTSVTRPLTHAVPHQQRLCPAHTSPHMPTTAPHSNPTPSHPTPLRLATPPQTRARPQAGKEDEAEELFKTALEIREKLLGPLALDTAASLSDMTLLLMDQGRLAEAEPLLRRCGAGQAWVEDDAVGPQSTPHACSAGWPQSTPGSHERGGCLRRVTSPCSFRRLLAPVPCRVSAILPRAPTRMMHRVRLLPPAIVLA